MNNFNLTGQVNQPITFYLEYNKASVDSLGVRSYLGTTNTNSVFTSVELSPAGITAVTFVPSSTGRHVVTINGTICGYIEVVAKTVLAFLKNIEDEALGSWAWNKQTNKLVMLTQEASVLAEFNVTETLTSASRERI
jgi:hypothetical protein